MSNLSSLCPEKLYPLSNGRRNVDINPYWFKLTSKLYNIMCACTHVYASWSRGMVRRIWLWNTVILIDNNAHVCTCSSSFPFCLGQGSDFKYRLTTGRRGWRIYVELFVNDSYKIEVFRIDTLVLISVSLFYFFFNVKNLMQTVVMEKGKGIHKLKWV